MLLLAPACQVTYKLWNWIIPTMCHLEDFSVKWEELPLQDMCFPMRPKCRDACTGSFTLVSHLAAVLLASLFLSALFLNIFLSVSITHQQLLADTDINRFPLWLSADNPFTGLVYCQQFGDFHLPFSSNLLLSPNFWVPLHLRKLKKLYVEGYITSCGQHNQMIQASAPSLSYLCRT